MGVNMFYTRFNILTASKMQIVEKCGKVSTRSALEMERRTEQQQQQ